MSNDTPEPGRRHLPSGTPVEVRAGLEARFCAGFEVAGTAAGGYRLRRLSDRSEVPGVFTPADVRTDRG